MNQAPCEVLDVGGLFWPLVVLVIGLGVLRWAFAFLAFLRNSHERVSEIQKLTAKVEAHWSTLGGEITKLQKRTGELEFLVKD